MQRQCRQVAPLRLAQAIAAQGDGARLPDRQQIRFSGRAVRTNSQRQCRGLRRWQAQVRQRRRQRYPGQQHQPGGGRHGLAPPDLKELAQIGARPGDQADGAGQTRQQRQPLGEGRALRYPVGVGKAGKQWAGTTRIDGKYRQPAWAPPAEVKRDNPSIPDIIPGGSPSNPMGVAAMTLAGGEYAIHGTNRPNSVGGYVSYGCVRMYNQDITDLFDRVEVGTQVVVTAR